MSWQERIIIDSTILKGKPVIKDIRIAVEFIIDLMAQGWSESEISRNYPGLKQEDFQACLSYTGDLLRSEKSSHARRLLMRLLANENIPLPAIQSLWNHGYDVL
jgi:uncharacterized protein (DUF433 family)